MNLRKQYEKETGVKLFNGTDCNDSTCANYLIWLESQLEPRSSWVSVKSGLPKLNTPVWIYADFLDRVAIGSISVSDDGDRWYYEDGYIPLNPLVSESKITHWAPMNKPEPPRG